MKAIPFDQATTVVAANQPEYTPLPAFVGQVGREPGQIGLISCFELSDEDIEDIIKHRKIWHIQMTFGMPAQPIDMRIADTVFAPAIESENDVEPLNP